MQAFQTVDSFVDHLTGFAESFLEELGSFDFVFDHQDLHLSRAFLKSGFAIGAVYGDTQGGDSGRLRIQSIRTQTAKRTASRAAFPSPLG